jgi:hypothetical protein
VTIHFT